MSQSRKKVLVIMGTRPEAIKLAPVVQQLRQRPDRWDARVIATAQHREMLDSVLSLFKIDPAYDLNIMRPEQSLFDVTERALVGLGRVLESEMPDLVIVQGDTTTSMVGALAAFYLKIPVGHVEAGLRTGERYSPFPEEINRELTSRLTTLHFAPTAASRENLIRECIRASSILITGNTAIDALVTIASREENDSTDVPVDPSLKSNERLILITVHRRESFGKPIRVVFSTIGKIAAEKRYQTETRAKGIRFTAPSCRA